MRIAVIIPSYKVREHIIQTISAVGQEVERIYVVDDKCPDNSGEYVNLHCNDERVVVLFNKVNLGVGGAMISGYLRAIADGMDILVKIDGDGQMDPSLIEYFTRPIELGHADYTKGNRFFSSKALKSMPLKRLVGNAALSFITKASSGYWDILDPTNGYTAIHARVAAVIDWDKVSKRYFFESDILFHLGRAKACVVDIPLMSLYGTEESNLHIKKVIPVFLKKNTRNLFSRLISAYFVRGFSVGSMALLGAVFLLTIGSFLAILIGIKSNVTGVPTSLGAIFSVGLMLIFGFQLLMTFLSVDMASSARKPIYPRLGIVPGHPLTQSYPSTTQCQNLTQKRDQALAKDNI